MFISIWIECILYFRYKKELKEFVCFLLLGWFFRGRLGWELVEGGLGYVLVFGFGLVFFVRRLFFGIL